MRKERGDLIGVDDLVDPRENVGEVLDGIHADARARDDERVEERELFAGLFAVDEEKAFCPSATSLIAFSARLLSSGMRGSRSERPSEI